jgi:hypothetical protein
MDATLEDGRTWSSKENCWQMIVLESQELNYGFLRQVVRRICGK